MTRFCLICTETRNTLYLRSSLMFIQLGFMNSWINRTSKKKSNIPVGLTAIAYLLVQHKIILIKTNFKIIIQYKYKGKNENLLNSNFSIDLISFVAKRPLYFQNFLFHKSYSNYNYSLEQSKSYIICVVFVVIVFTRSNSN